MAKGTKKNTKSVTDIVDELVKDEVVEEIKTEDVTGLKEEVVDEVVTEEVTGLKEERKIRKQINRNALIPIVNFTNGTFTHTSLKTGANWTLDGFGATGEMEFGELMAINSSSSVVLTEPWIVILDEDAVDYLGLNSLYEKLVMPNKFEKFLRLDVDKTKEILEKAPTGFKLLVVSRVKQLITEGKFDSLSKKQLIEEICNVDLDS